jgi:hypothetical protein
MLKLVNMNNKKYSGVYRAYCNSDMTNLYDLYKQPSNYKHIAYRYCRKMFDDLNGYDFRIIGGNCMAFSVGFKYKKDNGQEMFVYITKDYDREMVVA